MVRGQELFVPVLSRERLVRVVVSPLGAPMRAWRGHFLFARGELSCYPWS